MRSRFSAYALGLVEYLIQTTDKENPSYMQDVQTWRIQIEAFCKNTQFVGLKISEFNDEGEIATVTFTAYLTQSSKDATFSECSRFRKIQGRWMYIDGVVKSTEG